MFIENSKELNYEELEYIFKPIYSKQQLNKMKQLCDKFNKLKQLKKEYITHE